MVSLPSFLPPMPSCFSNIIGYDSSQLHEHERIFALRTLIRKGMCAEASKMCSGNLSHEDRDSQSRGDSHDSVMVTEKDGYNNKASLALSKLKQEMSHLRQHDLSLLCQLWTLQEAIDEYRNLMSNQSETNSEYSYVSTDRDLDSITSMDEFDLGDDLGQDGMYESTSSLFYQISQLQERMEADFEPPTSSKS